MAPNDTLAKYVEMFARRAAKGQCVNHPYLGCREFAARFRLIENLEAEPAAEASMQGDLGWMFYDFDFSDLANPQPRFFRAGIEHGVLDLQRVEVRG